MPADPSRLGIYILDVGQGDCTFIVPPQGEGAPILFDCNDAYVAERFASNHDVTHLAAVIASHLDRDHIRGIVPFLTTHFARGGTLERLVVGVDRPPAEDGPAHEIATLLEHAIRWERTPPCAGFALVTPVRDRAGPLRIAAGPGWTVDLVLPFHGDYAAALGLGVGTPNRCSAVLRICRAGASVLVGGDAPLASWDRLEPALLPARAVRVPHHGGDLGASARFPDHDALYGAIGARHSLVSVGTHNAHGHPDPDHIAAARRGSACRVRCTQLTPRCHPTPGAMRREALRLAGAVEPTYRHTVALGDPRKRRPDDEVPCAGSIVLWIDASGALEIEPRPRGAHDRLIGKMLTPLCAASP